jgi:integrase
LESARADGDRLYAAYVLILITGLRKGEVLGLGWDEIDLSAGTVAIDWQIQRVGKVRGIERRRTKTASSDATLPLPPICVAALKDQSKAQETAKDEAVGVRRITVHDARRTCESLLADLDVHPRVAMQILRHANFKITMEIYTQIADQRTRDALKRLGESLG